MNMLMLQGPPSERARSQKGAVLVEFALILPVFLLLLFGVITFSIALYNKTVLTMATREGARGGAKYSATNYNADGTINTTSITAKASAIAREACRENLVSFVSGMNPNIPAPTISGNMLTVRANVDYSGIYIFPTMTISAESSMRIE